MFRFCKLTLFLIFIQVGFIIFSKPTFAALQWRTNVLMGRAIEMLSISSGSTLGFSHLILVSSYILGVVPLAMLDFFGVVHQEATPCNLPGVVPPSIVSSSFEFPAIVYFEFSDIVYLGHVYSDLSSILILIRVWSIICLKIHFSLHL